MNKQSEQTNEEELLLGDSVVIDDFINEMASRGLIIPGPPSPWKRFVSLMKAPFRFISGVFAWISWRLYGKLQYELAVKKSLERWKRLAGLAPPPDDGSPTSKHYLEQQERRRVEVQRLLAAKPATDAAAALLHAEIIRKTVVKVPLPVPEKD